MDRSGITLWLFRPLRKWRGCRSILGICEGTPLNEKSCGVGSSGRDRARKFCRVNCSDSDRMNKIDRIIIRPHLVYPVNPVKEIKNISRNGATTPRFENTSDVTMLLREHRKLLFSGIWQCVKEGRIDAKALRVRVNGHPRRQFHSQCVSFQNAGIDFVDHTPRANDPLV